MKKLLLLTVVVLSLTACKKKPEYRDRQVSAAPAQHQEQKSGNEEYATVRITLKNGNSYTTSKEIAFGKDTTTINLDSGKRVWVGTDFVAEEQ